MHRIFCRSLVLAALGVSLLAGWRSVAAEPSRVSINDSWRFIRYGAMPDGSVAEEPAAVESPVIDDSYWRKLDVPHDWGVEGPFRKELPGATGKLPWVGIGWYRKSIFIPASAQGMRTYVDIDGAMSHAKVYLNGALVGERPYGYSSFRVDLTDKVKAGSNNLLAIRLDNPPDSSRWYPGGGLYRNIWLVRLPQVHFEQWGIFVRTRELRPDKAVLAVDSEVVNKGTVGRTVSIRYEVFRKGQPKPVRTAEVSLLSVGSKASSERVTSIEIPNPVLWSVNAPELYTLKATLVGEGREELDVQEVPFGIRKAEFTATDGFRLNGQRVPIRGVCEHHDLGPLGTAINVGAMERRLLLLKEMGANALRTAHNPPAPELLDLCDRLGILVLDEAFDCWKIGKNKNDYARDFDKWHEKDLSTMVRRDRNHPSVVLWSIGNEIREQWQINGVELAKKLRDIVRQHDDSRPVTMGMNNEKAVENEFYKGADVIGINYKPHMYGAIRQMAPGVPVIGAETSSTVSSRGVYYFPISKEPQGGFGAFQVSSFDLYHPRWAQTPQEEWVGQDQNRYVAGEFVWTGFDYLGEPTPFNNDLTNVLNYQDDQEKARAEAEIRRMGGNMPSRSSYFGIFDLCGFPKDRYYLYKARWKPDEPVAHILPHWTWPDRVGKVTPVHVYTNGDEAELFLNDKSLGRKPVPRSQYRVSWDEVIHEAGEVRVVVYKNGRRWAKDTVMTAGKPAKFEVAPHSPEIDPKASELVYLDVTAVDEAGTPVPSYSQRVAFYAQGAVEVIAVCNGDAASLDPFQSNSIPAFSGRAQAIVRAKKGLDGKGSVTIRSGNLEAKVLNFKVAK